MIVVLDPGHGAGKAFNRGGLLFNEGDQNYKYACVLKEELERYGIIVRMTRSNIKDNPSLYKRGTMYSGDLFISLHTNAASRTVRGCEIFLSVRNENTALAESLCKGIAEYLGTPNRGVKRKYDGKNDWYGVLASSKSCKISMIIEHVFHTNMEDSKVYLNHQRGLAQKTAGIIANYYGISMNRKSASKITAKWKKNSKGYWYEFSDGSYPRERWLNVGGVWCYFDGEGYAYRNQWLHYKDNWYYFNKRCYAIYDEWLKWNGRWYYFNKDAIMVRNQWVQWKGKWYYLGWDGAMYTSATTPDDFKVNWKGEWVK